MAETRKLRSSRSASPNQQRLRLTIPERGIAGESEGVVHDTAPGGEQRGWERLQAAGPVPHHHNVPRLARGLGPELGLTGNRARGWHRRKEAIAHPGLVDRHLADGRDWLLGGAQQTFVDVTLCTATAFSEFPVDATPLDGRFEQFDRFRCRCVARPRVPRRLCGPQQRHGGTGLSSRTRVNFFTRVLLSSLRPFERDSVGELAGSRFGRLRGANPAIRTRRGECT